MRTFRDVIPLSASAKEEWLRRTGLVLDGERPETAAFMDIETTGFSRMYDTVYLVGFLYCDEGQFVLEQFLIEGQQEEPALVKAYEDLLSRFKTVITFNGDMFDLPFMETRHKVLHIKGLQPQTRSVDLYRRYRPLTKVFGWENCRLKTIERFLGIDREDPFSGGELIEVFEEYASSGDPRLERTLLLHNYEDVLNMPNLLLVEGYIQSLKNSPVEELSIEREGRGEVALRAVLGGLMPVSYEGTVMIDKKEDIRLSFRTEAGSPVVFLRWPVIEGQYYHYLPNPEDYFYLPDSDSIIHRSLADSLEDGVKKRKATEKNCRIAKEGRFLPAFEPEQEERPVGLHEFRAEKKQKAVFYDLEEVIRQMESLSLRDKERLFHCLLKI